MPDFSKHFVIECDASGRGLGVVLMQDKQPIAYISNQLSGRTLSRSAYEWELMALVLAVQHCKPLLGRCFTVWTDQRSLKHLLTQPLTTLVQQNWAAKLLGYDFEIIYKEGVNNKAANALSRRHEDGELAAITFLKWLDWPALVAEVRADAGLSSQIYKPGAPPQSIFRGSGWDRFLKYALLGSPTPFHGQICGGHLYEGSGEVAWGAGHNNFGLWPHIP